MEGYLMSEEATKKVEIKNYGTALAKLFLMSAFGIIFFFIPIAPGGQAPLM